MRVNYHGSKAKYRNMRTGYHGGEAKYRDMRTDYHGGKAKYRDMRTNYHGGKAKYRDMRTNYHGGKAKYRDMRTNYHGSEAKYRDMRVGSSPARDLRDLKDFRDLDSPSAQPFGLKAQKLQAQGKANNVSRHPGWTMPRMVRPTGAKAKSIRFNTFTAFALSERTSSYTSTQGAVPAELALGYVLSAPLGRAPHNHNPSLPSPHRPSGWFLKPHNLITSKPKI